MRATPPLPFMGNKKNMLKNIYEVCKTLRENGQIDDETLILDVFGGSGLIAHNLKRKYPKCRVIWNDFDNYQYRLEQIATTEHIRKILSDLLKPFNLERIPQPIKQTILDILKELESKGEYIDYTTISSWLLFSGNYVQSLARLAKQTFYNRTPQKELALDNYLQGVERTRVDFTSLLDTYHHTKNKLLILDPPYLQTQVGNYKDHFTLGQFFMLIERVQKPFLFFGSGRSDILEAFDYFSRYHKDLADIEVRQAKLNIGLDQSDYIIYPAQRSLLKFLA